MITTKTTNNGTTKQNPQFPILVIDTDGCVFYVSRYTNGRLSPCINSKEVGEGGNLYSSQNLDLTKPFPQHGYDLFNGAVTLIQEPNK